MKQYKKASYTLRTVWGIAKSPELRMSDEELHELVAGHTGKDSLKKLTEPEIAKVVSILSGMKESVRKQERKSTHPSVRGNPSTVNQRKKIYKLCERLGWKDPARVNGMCRKMFGVSVVEWLNYQQCSKFIEALKSMVKRQEEREGQDASLQANSEHQG